MSIEVPEHYKTFKGGICIDCKKYSYNRCIDMCIPCMFIRENAKTKIRQETERQIASGKLSHEEIQAVVEQANIDIYLIDKPHLKSLAKQEDVPKCECYCGLK